MARVNLLGGTYLARSPIANAERCINLYPEKNPTDASAPFTHLPTPGLLLLATPTPAVARALYTATNGSLYYVAGNTLYSVDKSFNLTSLITLFTGFGPVEMQDNGNVLLVVDGSTSGYAVNLQAGIAGSIQSWIGKNNGSGGTDGLYTVPLTGGSGLNATIQLTVASGTVTVATIINAGTGYVAGDFLGVSSGGTGVPGLINYQIEVTAVGAAVNAAGYVQDPNFLGGTGIGYIDTFLVLSQPTSRNFYSSLSNITFSALTSGTSGQPQLVSIISAGSGATADGLYANVPLTNGSGTGAVADIQITGGVVTGFALDNAGQGYNAGDVLSVAQSSIPGLANFQVELVQVNNAAFDPLFVAAKTGYPDQLATLITVHREIWLFGSVVSTEVWYDAGGTQFPFQIMPGVFIQHGCIAPASVATHDLDVFWLGVDNAGQGTVYMGSGYRAQKISTWAIADKIQKALISQGTISDAIGFVYKQEDHIFYILTFPTANFTIVYDRTENLWHERAFTDPNGNFNRVLFNCAAQAYGVNVVGDWANGKLYKLDLTDFTDNGAQIVRYRSFPHLLNDGKLQIYDRFTADVQCGTGIPGSPTHTPELQLLVSDDRGATFWQAQNQSMGQQGQYITQPIWHQLGMARDRVFALQWSDATFTALQGAWIDVTPSEK